MGQEWKEDQDKNQEKDRDKEQEWNEEWEEEPEEEFDGEWNQEFGYSKENAPVLVTNEMLQCRDCRFRGQKTGACEKYTFKPADVLAGRTPCPAYKCEGEASSEEERGRYTSDSPDCEGCIFNFGNLNCAVYDSKPAAIVIEHRPCAERQQGGGL